MHDKIVGIDMKSAAGLFLGFSTLLVSSAAEACSYDSYNMGPSYSYSIYTSNHYRGPDNLSLVRKADFIGVVRPYVVPGGRIDLKPEKMKSDWYFRPENLAWKEVRFKLLDVLKGRDNWNLSQMYPFVEGQKLPPPSRRHMARIPDTGFWETLNLRVPKTKIVGATDSCGELYGEPRLLPNRDYIIGAKGSEILFALVVNGPDDPLVEAFKDIANDREIHAMRMPPKDYFGQMAGYVHFKMKRCADTEDLYWQSDNEWNRAAKPPKYDKLKKQRRLYSIIDSSSSDLPLIDVRDIYTYGRTVDRYYNVDCAVGQEYLAITRPDQTGYRGDYWFSAASYEHRLPHRFLLITDGQVNSDEYLSNIQIDMEGLIPVEQVKAWIREGLQADTMAE